MWSGSHLAKTSCACSETPARELETLGQDALTVSNVCPLVVRRSVYSSTSLSSDIDEIHFATRRPSSDGASPTVPQSL